MATLVFDAKDYDKAWPCIAKKLSGGLAGAQPYLEEVIRDYLVPDGDTLRLKDTALEALKIDILRLFEEHGDVPGDETASACSK